MEVLTDCHTGRSDSWLSDDAFAQTAVGGETDLEEAAKLAPEWRVTQPF
jgi:hypothetical protein